MHISNVTSKGQVTIPAAERRRLGIKPGGKVRFIAKGKQVLIEAVNEEPVASLFGMLKAPKGRGFADADTAIRQAWDQRSATPVGKPRK